MTLFATDVAGTVSGDLRASLADALDLFERVTRTANDVLYDAPVGGAARWRGAVTALLGYPEHAMQPTEDFWRSLLHADDRARVLASLDATLASRADRWSCTYRLRRLNGTYATVLDRASIIRDASGAATRLVGWLIDLSERASLGEELHELQHRYAALFDQSLDAIVFTRPDGSVIDANPAAIRMFGVPRELLPKFRVEDAYCCLADREAVVAALLERGMIVNHQVRFRRASGETFLASYSGTVCRRGAEIGGFIGVIRDITEQTRMETELRVRERELATVLEHSPDIITRVDRDHRILYANAVVERYVGRPAAWLIGKSIDELDMPAELVSAWRSAQREVFRTRRPGFLQFTLPGPHGPVVLDTHLVPEFDGDTVPTLVTFTRDVTELHAAQAAQKASEARFRAIIENANEIVALVDAEGTVLYVTPSVRAMNADPQAVTGLRLSDFIVPEDWPRVRDAMTRACAEPGRRESVSAYRAVAPNGRTLWVEATFTNMLDHPAIAALVIHSRDVTERVEAEAARQRAEEQFRQAQKLEAIGRLAGGVAHDFNNLLTAITGSAELALEAAGNEELRADIETIRTAAFKAAAITRQLLAFGRKQMTSPRIIGISDAVLGFEPLLRRIVRPEVSFELSLESASAIEIDPVQLEQAILNLVVNANDAMLQGGQLTVGTRTVGDRAIVEVHDTGVGIEDRIRARIFEPFFTTKAPGQGTGLGLATVYGIVAQAGGTVEVDSAPRRGSTFRLVFPAVAAELVMAPAIAATPETLRGTETILLVDDEASIRMPVAKTLTRQGYTVIEAKHGRDALTLLEERGAAVDLVVTDLVMPEMGGAELIAALRARWPNQRVIVMSGYSQDVALARGAAQDAPFLQKPFTMQALSRAVREMLDRAPEPLTRVA